MRKLSLKDGVINNKKVDYNLYGALQEMSYLKDGKRFVYASDATPKKLEEKLTPAGATKPIISNSTIKRGLALFQKPEINLITVGTVEDLHGKTVKCYWLNEDENFYQLIPLDTLRFLINFTNSNSIKVYAYLLNKYQNFDGYSFTGKELIEVLGMRSNNLENKTMIKDVLHGLSLIGLIEYVEYYEKNYNEAPVPRKRLVNVKTNVKGLK